MNGGGGPPLRRRSSLALAASRSASPRARAAGVVSRCACELGRSCGPSSAITARARRCVGAPLTVADHAIKGLHWSSSSSESSSASCAAYAFLGLPLGLPAGLGAPSPRFFHFSGRFSGNFSQHSWVLWESLRPQCPQTAPGSRPSLGFFRQSRLLCPLSLQLKHSPGSVFFFFLSLLLFCCVLFSVVV